jgi:predicted nucleic acid-binding protein
MILVDTSVWVDHLRRGNARLTELLEESEVAWHPFVLGELVLGNLRRGSEVPALLVELPQVVLAEHDEALGFVAAHRLGGAGIGWVDVHLLCSVALSHARLWTLDRRLAAVAARLGLAA